jgi:exodeoxyribonuclease V alpha subunit
MILTKQQTLALEMVKNHKISILTGSPGTGKTTIIKVIVDYMKEQNCKILLATPTGKSAQVMASACSYEANTIHRMLRPIPVLFPLKLMVSFNFNSLIMLIII